MPIADSDVKWARAPKIGLLEQLYVPAIMQGLRTTVSHTAKTLFGGGSLTQQFPEVVPQMPPNYRGVHRLNRDEKGRPRCVACYMCSTACPAHCIDIVSAPAPADWQPDGREKYPETFVIDELRCIYCGMCEQACPVDAIELTTLGVDFTGLSREEMMFDKEKLLSVFDRTVQMGTDPVRTRGGALGVASEPADAGADGIVVGAELKGPLTPQPPLPRGERGSKRALRLPLSPRWERGLGGEGTNGARRTGIIHGAKELSMPYLLPSASPPFAASLAEGLLNLWPLWLPLLAGGAAVFLLLPRPRAYPVLWGALAAVLALVLAGGLLLKTTSVTVEVLLFYAFSVIAITAGGLLITQQSPARAALAFTLVVLSTCGLFLLLAAPFLMAATIIIYAGAIVVTFLFVLMLAAQAGLSDADARSREPLLATITGFVLLGALLYVLQTSYPPPDQVGAKLLARTRELAKLDDPERIKAELHPVPEKNAKGLLAEYTRYLNRWGLKELARKVEDIQATSGSETSLEDTRKVLASLEEISIEAERLRLETVRQREAPAPPARATLSPLSGPPSNVPAANLRRDPDTGLPALPADNSAYLGRSLFTDFLLPVELAGTLLLVATIGAIAIAHRRASQRAA